MVVADVPILVVARHAVVAVDLLGAEVFDAIKGDEVTALEVDVVLKDLPALQLAEQVGKGRTQVVGINIVEECRRITADGRLVSNGATLGVAPRQRHPLRGRRPGGTSLRSGRAKRSHWHSGSTSSRSADGSRPMAGWCQMGPPSGWPLDNGIR